MAQDERQEPEPETEKESSSESHSDLAAEIDQFFASFADANGIYNRARVRCQACGFVRSQNLPRQLDHLRSCKEFLDTIDGQAFVQTHTGKKLDPPLIHTAPSSAQKDTSRAQVHDRRTLKPKPPGSQHQEPLPARAMPHPLRSAKPTSPSLSRHLTAKNQNVLFAATRNMFLAQEARHCWNAAIFHRWFSQLCHIARARTSFIGALISKIKIEPESALGTDPMFRALDLLCSAASNSKKELQFLESARVQLGLPSTASEMDPATKAFVDLLASVTSPTSSFLQGMVVLWSIENLMAMSFHSNRVALPDALPPNTYSLPSYLSTTSTYPPPAPPAAVSGDDTRIISTLITFVTNWTSPNFTLFVDACRASVDELANTQTSGNGLLEMQNCEQAFQQTVWLWQQILPHPPPPHPPPPPSQNATRFVVATNASSQVPVPLPPNGSPVGGPHSAPPRSARLSTQVAVSPVRRGSSSTTSSSRALLPSPQSVPEECKIDLHERAGGGVETTERISPSL